MKLIVIFVFSIVFSIVVYSKEQKVSYRVCANGKNPVAEQVPEDIFGDCDFGVPYMSYCSSRRNTHGYLEIKLYDKCGQGNSIHHCQFPFKTSGSCYHIAIKDRKKCTDRPGYSYNRKFQLCRKVSKDQNRLEFAPNFDR